MFNFFRYLFNINKEIPALKSNDSANSKIIDQSCSEVECLVSDKSNNLAIVPAAENNINNLEESEEDIDEDGFFYDFRNLSNNNRWLIEQCSNIDNVEKSNKDIGKNKPLVGSGNMNHRFLIGRLSNINNLEEVKEDIEESQFPFYPANINDIDESEEDIDEDEYFFELGNINNNRFFGRLSNINNLEKAKEDIEESHFPVEPANINDQSLVESLGIINNIE